VLVGVAVATAARLLGMPVPAALGLAAGVLAMLPHVGIALGTVPLILLVLALRSDAAAAVTAVVVLAAQLGDSFWLRRRVAARSVDIGLLVPWIVAIVGYTVYGVGGAAYALAFAVFGLALIDEVGRPRVPGLGAGNGPESGPGEDAGPEGGPAEADGGAPEAGTADAPAGRPVTAGGGSPPA
jgi:predicted PurR-regulated permease PerM